MDEIAKAIRDISAKRADGVPIPARAPSGWVHLSVAMAKIAHAMLGEANDTWQDAFRAVIEGALKDATDAPSDPLAAEVGAYVCEQIAEICRTETLITGFRRVGGACDVAVMPGAWWDTEDPELRFSTFSIDPDDLTSSRLDLPCWIWVDASSLANQIERIERWKGRTLIFGVYGGEACSLAEAVALVSEAVDGDAYRAFLWLAANQGTRVVAGEMVRSFQGVPVERDIEWPVPPSLWLCVNPDDPARRLAAGYIRAINGPSEWTLSSLRVDLDLLRETLADQRASIVAKSQAIVAGNSAQPTMMQDRPSLPTSAKPSDKRHEEFAHLAAEKVRADGMTPQAAFRAVAPQDKTRDKDSILRAIRSAYDLMYDRTGHAIKN